MAASRVEYRGYVPDIDAYQHFLLGREYLRSRVSGYQQNAIEHFDKAIEIDPAYPEPYGGRAIALFLVSGDVAGYGDRQQQLARTLDTALSLESPSALVFAAQGLNLVETDPVAAEAALRKALELEPNLPAVRGSWLHNALVSQGRWEEAQSEQERALERDPLDPRLVANVANEYTVSGDFRRAEAILLRLLDLPTPPGAVYDGLAELYGRYGRIVDAMKMQKQRIIAHPEASSEMWSDVGLLALSYGRLGMWERAEYFMGLAEAATSGDPGIVLQRIYLHRLRGDDEEIVRVIDDRIDRYGLDPQRLPGWFNLIRAGARLAAEPSDEAIETLEATLRIDEQQMWGNLEIDFVQYLAHAYVKKGNDTRADEILRRVAEHIGFLQEKGRARDPDTLMQVAVNHAVGGDAEEALHALEVAVASGCRHYYYALHDPRLDALRDDPRFQSLMALMKADIDRQRELVEAGDAKQDFAELLAQRAAARSD
jgi:tetratricopeptide (TPR) repeat protein